MTDKNEIRISIRDLADGGARRFYFEVSGSVQNVEEIVIRGTGALPDDPMRFTSMTLIDPDTKRDHLSVKHGADDDQ